MNQAEHYNDPPKLADRFFDWYCYKPIRETISGDLYERYVDNIDRFGQRKANRKYWLDVIRFMNRHTLKRSRNSNSYNNNQIAMFSNYFKVGFRNLLKNRSFTLINVLGLSVSMAVCLVIILMINDQMSYDKFQTNRDKIYRFTHQLTTGVNLPFATSPMPLADRIKSDYSGIDQVVVFERGFGGELLQKGKAINLTGLFTGPSFFEMFSFKLESGDPKTALSEPNTVVLRNDIAEKLFPNENPVGQTIDFEDKGSFEITGVLEEFPGKTHIDFEALASLSSVPTLEKNGSMSARMQNWQSVTGSWVYFTMNESGDLESIRPYLTKYSEENYNENTDFIAEFDIQKMTNITPGPLYGNQIGSSMPNFFVIGLGVLAFLIIVCAAFNYTNLSAARALTRTKEVGVRKVMGARRTQLTIQFVVESILVSFLSVIVAIGLLQFLMPAFEGLQLSSLLNWDLKITPKAYLQFFLFSLATGLVTGLFPALYLSSFKPIEAMKNILGANKLSKVNLRKALIVSQFVITIVLIVSSTLVYKQIKFMVEKDYGYTKENIINIQLQGQDYGILKTELEKLPFISKISAANNIPNRGQSNDIEVKKSTVDEPIDFNYFSVDEHYIDNLDLTLLAGSNFIPSHGEGAEKVVLINETGAKFLGYENPMDIVDQPIFLNDSTKVNVGGVIKDYNYQILYMNIGPMILRYRPQQFRYAQVKLSGFDISEEIIQIEKVWDTVDPNHDFEFKTFQGEIDEFNAFFYDILYIVGLIAVLSISIAGMGLLGIAAYSIQTRLKEVSIRKVLGANVKTLVLLLSRGFIVLFVIAMVIGFSIAYLGNSAWLNGFAYRVDFGIGTFALTALAMIVVGLLTIGFQAWKATFSNPAQTLRDD